MEYKEYNEKDLQSFEYETTIQSDGNIIGTCELGKATIQMINDSNNYSVFKDSWIKTIHGSFYIHDVSPVQEKVNIKLSCYDIKYKLDTDYDSSLYKWPLTLKEWRNAIFTNCDVEYDDSSFPNSDLILTSEPYIPHSGDKISNRDAIKTIAQAGCSAVTTDEDDIFYFSWFEEIVHQVKDWTELTTEKESTSPINVTVLGRGDVEDNVYYPKILPDNPIEFRIDNNYILDPQDTSITDKRYSVIEPIYNRVNGFTYLIFNMRTQHIANKLSIKLGQKVSYKDIWNNDLIAYIMTKKINWLGGEIENDDNYEITLSSEEIKESSTNYSYATNTLETVRKTERTANKLEGVITDLVEEVDEHSKKITDVEQAIDTISQTVSDIENLEREVSNKNYIYIENAMMGQLEYLEINGPFSLLYPSDDLFPSNDLYLLDSYLIIDKTKELSNDAIRIHLPYFNLKDNEKFIINNGESFINKEDGTTEKLSKYRNIEENEDLSGKTLYYDFPSSFEDELGQYHRDKGEYYLEFISTNKDKNISTSFYWSQFAYPNVILEYDNIFSGDGTGVTNQGTIKLSDDFGKIISIDLKNPTFKYLKIMEDMDKIDLPLFEGDNYIYLESFQDNEIVLSAKYIIKNSYTDKFATKVEMNSAINQTAESINLEVSKKVGEDEVVSTINQSAEQITLKSNRLVVESDNFSLTADGELKSRSGDIGGYTIDGKDGFVFKIYAPKDFTNDDLTRVKNITMGNIQPTNEDFQKYDLNNDGKINSVDYTIIKQYCTNGITTTNYGLFEISIPHDNKLTTANTGYKNSNNELVSGFNFIKAVFPSLLLNGNSQYYGVHFYQDSSDNVTIELDADLGKITCVSLNQTSLAEKKKNFKKIDNALEILNKVDIYKYNFLFEKDNDKKHIGFIIGDDYNYSEEITSKDNDGVDIYSMLSVLWQVVKEQQVEIDKLKEEVKNG